jgi:hypothetical protein
MSIVMFAGGVSYLGSFSDVSYMKEIFDGILVQLLCFWTLPIVLFLFKTQTCSFFKTEPCF